MNIAEQEPVAAVLSHTDGLGADAVIEAVGATPAVKQSLAVVCNGGQVTWIGNSAPEVEINITADRDARADRAGRLLL